MITSKRCYLELLAEEDFDALLEMFLEPDAFKYIAPLKDKTPEFYNNFLLKKQQEVSQVLGYYWVIRDHSSKEFIGAINLTPIPNTNKTQIGWQLKSKHHRKGLAYEAAQAAFQFALNKTTIDPIYAVFESENLASEKMIKKLGFQKNSEQKEAGITVETYVYRRTKN